MNKRKFLTKVIGNGNRLPRTGLIFYAKTPDLVDSIGLSISDKSSVRTEIWALLFDENDDPYSDEQRVTNIEASEYLNNGLELGGSSAKGYFLYLEGTSETILRKAYRWAGVVFISYVVPWLSGYAYRKELLIDHTAVTADLADFPLFVDLSGDTDIPTKSLSSGLDIVATADDATTVLGSEVLATGTIDSFSDNGAWCWFSDPRAIYYNGKTYIGSIRSAGDIVVLSYDHSSYEQAEFELQAALQVDDHANPSILIRDDGRLVVFYCAHNGPDMFYRVSTNPGDISAWGAEQTLGTNTAGVNGYSYSHPCILSAESNKIFLFFS